MKSKEVIGVNERKRVAIITGASKGLGRLMAIDMVRRGYDVLITGRNEKRLMQVKKECMEIRENSVVSLACDLNELSNLDLIFKCVMKQWGRLDVLINNAAVGYPGTFHSGDYLLWEEMLRVNTLVPCIMMQKALHYFEPDADAQIINISSTSAWRISKGGTFYPATKYALRALSEAVRKELVESGSKVRVTCISPARMTTSFFTDSDEDIKKENEEQILLEPEQVLEAVRFVLDSDRSMAVQDIILRTTKQYE